jgi:hypothetical protein
LASGRLGFQRLGFQPAELSACRTFGLPGFQPTPYLRVYGATKAFVLSSARVSDVG